MTLHLKQLEQDKAKLESEGARSAQLLRDITEAQSLTCRKFEELQGEIERLREDNRRLATMSADKGNAEDNNKIRGTLENAEEAIRRMKEEIQARYQMQNALQFTLN